ncbi:hypothetical protein [Mesorhizobium sp. M0058]|uniref:hypothetical protein n=1 Tax=Mesorhizobium sp. M0058 TaxID=2956865 RepID=UPI00333A50E7
MRGFLVVLMVMFAGHALAGGKASEICLKAAAHAYLKNSLEPIAEQDFSDLSPPSARVSYDPGNGAEYWSDCTFDGHLKLVQFCLNGACMAAGNKAFDKIVVLLARDGY